MILVNRKTFFPASFVSDLHPSLVRSKGACVAAHANVCGQIIRVSGLVYGDDSILKSTLGVQAYYCEAGTSAWSERFIGLVQSWGPEGLREELYSREDVYGVPAVLSDDPEKTMTYLCKALEG